MTRLRRIVINAKKKATDRLPEWANEGAVLVEWLHQHEYLDEIGRRLRIQREGGYVGLDLIMFLLFFLTSGFIGSIKVFGERASAHREQLGALGGRRKIPSPASVSRILAATDDAHSEAIAEWLLIDASHATELMRHPSVITRDATGEAWQVFDLDPTISVVRQRALPECEDLPAARRRSIEAQPGYTGRKRGDVQLSRMTLQHAGSGLWLGLWMAPGNGEWRKHSEAAVRRVHDVCEKIDHPVDHALVRVDGAGGNVPLITACQDIGVHHLTRWSQYELLDKTEIRAHLNATAWHEVADSGSGPRRHATEIGWVELHAAPATVRADGSAYDPVRSRLIVSRFRAAQPDKKRGAGVLIDGWQYEMYATDLPPCAWPADEVVTTYYGRCGEENRFCQEDRENGLDHIFSYNIHGQQLANLVGLFIWNCRICRGFELANPPVDVPPQPPRLASVASPAVMLTTDVVLPAADEHEKCDVVGADETSSPLGNGAMNDTVTIEQSTAFAANPTQDIASPPLTAITPSSTIQADERHVLQMALSAIDWPAFLKDRPGWRWDPLAGLECPNGKLHNMQSVKVRSHGRTRQLRFLAPYRACAVCQLRQGCTSSSAALFRKETVVTLQTEVAHPIHQLHASIHRSEPPPPPIVSVPVRPPETPNPPKSRHRSPVLEEQRSLSKPGPMWEAIREPPGAFAVTPAFLLPAKLRQMFRRAHQQIEVHVHVQLPREKPRIAVFALTASERQHRRLTWTARQKWNALPDGALVQIVFAGGESVETLLRGLSEAGYASNAA